MKKSSTFLLSLLFFSLNLPAQFFKKEINRFDEDGLRTGLWKTYWDDQEKTPMSIGHFTKGRETGVCKEYHPNGNLRLKSRYQGNRIRMKYYSEDRKLERKGWAIIDYSSAEIHFYWHGKWKYFDNQHRLSKTSIFENGKETLSFVK